MFVQTVVVGRVIFLSRDRVQCQGELRRDVAVYGVAASLVFFVCSQGRVYFSGVLLMFAIYCIYVATVVTSEIRRHYKSTLLIADKSESETLSAASSFEEESSLDTPTTSYANANGEEESGRRDPPGNKYSARVLRLMMKQQNRRRQRIVEKRKGLVVERCDLPPYAGSNSQSSIWTHFHTTIYKDILRNSDLPAFERFCLVLEVPFIVLRQLVIPITSAAEYKRPVLATSIAFSPLWLSFYASMKYEHHDPYAYCLEKTIACVPFVVWPFCLSIFLGGAILMKFPLKADELKLNYSIPIALYGFGVATSFIDVIR